MHPTWDGESWAGLLGLSTDGGGADALVPRRTVQLIEYWGQSSHPTLNPGQHDTPPYFTGHAFTWWQDQTFNTWSCMRTPPQKAPADPTTTTTTTTAAITTATAAAAATDTIFCQWFSSWDDKESGNFSFEELYDIATDPYQLKNRAADLNAAELAAYRGNLTMLRNCKGSEECASAKPPALSLPPPMD